jgi:hypothetical protein
MRDALTRIGAEEFLFVKRDAAGGVSIGVGRVGDLPATQRAALGLEAGGRPVRLVALFKDQRGRHGPPKNAPGSALRN